MVIFILILSLLFRSMHMNLIIHILNHLKRPNIELFVIAAFLSTEDNLKLSK